MMKNVKFRLFKIICVFLLVSFTPFSHSNPLNPEQDVDNALDNAEIQAANPLTKTGSTVADDEQDHGLVQSFVKALIIIIISELGDKTFFIAAIFAMKYRRTTVFAGAIGALALMTALSVAIGFATMVIPRAITFYGAVGLFLIFGLKMLYEGYTMDPNDKEELEEVEGELKKKDEELQKVNVGAADVESGVVPAMTCRQKLFSLCSPVLIQSFTMTFLAEWGDRSQITTIVQAASDNPWGVLIGAILGHSICTGIAVIGGRMIAQRISVKSVTIIGGVFFIANAAFSLFTGPGS